VILRKRALFFAVSETTKKGICQINIAGVIKIMNGFVVLDIFGLRLLSCRTCNLIVLI
tara:strand:+ start:133 stop:306 length:174 start_codon:yes stop_codon:yes gene_type:complete